MAIETTVFDASEFMNTKEAQAELLADAFESGDLTYITHALGIVAKAKGMSEIAKKSGVTREALYRALSADGDPRLSTLIGVAKALGFKLQISPEDGGPALRATKIKKPVAADKALATATIKKRSGKEPQRQKLVRGKANAA